MPKKLSPEQELIAAHISATTAAFQLLVLCLQNTGALEQGQFQAALQGYLEMAKRDHGDAIKLSMLNELRQALVN